MRWAGCSSVFGGWFAVGVAVDLHCCSLEGVVALEWVLDVDQTNHCIAFSLLTTYGTLDAAMRPWEAERYEPVASG